MFRSCLFHKIYCCIQIFISKTLVFIVAALAPSEHSNTRSEIPDELPRSLLDGPRTLGSEISESSEGTLPKKPKLDADYETPSQG